LLRENNIKRLGVPQKPYQGPRLESQPAAWDFDHTQSRPAIRDALLESARFIGAHRDRQRQVTDFAQAHDETDVREAFAKKEHLERTISLVWQARRLER